MSKVLWEQIPNVVSKAREGAKAMSLAFVLLDFQLAGVRRRAQCTRRSVDMQQHAHGKRSHVQVEDPAVHVREFRGLWKH